MAEPLPETPVLPEGPTSPDQEGLYIFAGGLNRMLYDQLADIIRKANAGDITDGGVIVGDLDITGDLNITGDINLTGDMVVSGSITVADEAYSDGGWNGDLTVPTKNAIRDIWATLGTAAFVNTGTSGGTVPLLNGANTFSAAQTISGTTAFFTPLTLLLTEDGANNGPNLFITRVSASPAVNDLIGALVFAGRNNNSEFINYTAFLNSIISPTDGAEAGDLGIWTTVAGSFAPRVNIGGGVYYTASAGGDQGPGTLNFTNIYRSGNLVPGPASQATGDIVYRGASDWLRLAIGAEGTALQVASGVPAWSAPDFEFVGSVSASSSSQILIDSSTLGALAAGYDYIVSYENLQPSADAYLTMQYGTGGTPTYQNTNYDTVARAGGTANRNTITTAIYFEQTGSVGGATAGETKSGDITIPNPGGNQIHQARGVGKSVADDGSIREVSFAGRRTTAEVVTGLRFAMNTGNINSGTFYVWRRRIT